MVPLSLVILIIHVKHRRSPLFQGGLEIPFQLTLTCKHAKNVIAMYENTRLKNKYWKMSSHG